ncbi:fatty-acyl-CoA synthase [Breoghania corrubedonensis]|uniref:3-methylmercaptopropionyl-CoA ligase n=1 Tax=Breoghania corrubedonensis TaxID=665038 RepID=A0A2T5VIJ5_9HYPH|nr:AMP-binding protein [Breoghania corrubedonensis]PTW63546.1 fatty-acyl-CoA synthase [Breoghania corrubedonensis]
MEWLTDMAARRADLTPTRTAFIDHESGATLTFRQVNDRANALARALEAQTGETGARVAVLCHNRPDFFVLLFAAQKAGLVLVPLNWRQPPAELAPIIAESGARVLISDRQTAETAKALAQRCDLQRLSFEPGEGCDCLDDLAAAHSSAPLGDGRIPADRPWYLLFTSGTTGLPKAVIQTASMAWANAVNYVQATDLVSSDRAVNYLPLFHTAGINLFTLPLFLFGGTSTVLRKFDEDAVLDLIDRGDVSAFFAVPAIYQALALNGRFASTDFSHVRSLGCGGAPISANLLETYLRRGVTVCNGMGMTETGPTVFLMDPANAARKIGSVGKAQILSEIRLMDAEERVVEGAGEGELQIRGANVTPGYFGNEIATHAAFTNDGWLKTGDVGRRDEDGYWYIVDRLKDMYISGGENVYPAEVERVLVSHEAIQEAVVTGVPDMRWGEVGAAFLILRQGAELDLASLDRWCRDRLAAYKVPKSFRILEEMPRTAAGKVQKHVLRSTFLQSQTRQDIDQNAEGQRA